MRKFIFQLEKSMTANYIVEAPDEEEANVTIQTLLRDNLVNQLNWVDKKYNIDNIEMEEIKEY